MPILIYFQETVGEQIECECGYEWLCRLRFKF